MALPAPAAGPAPLDALRQVHQEFKDAGQDALREQLEAAHPELLVEPPGKPPALALQEAAGRVTRLQNQQEKLRNSLVRVAQQRSEIVVKLEANLDELLEAEREVESASRAIRGEFLDEVEAAAAASGGRQAPAEEEFTELSEEDLALLTEPERATYKQVVEAMAATKTMRDQAKDMDLRAKEHVAELKKLHRSAATKRRRVVGGGAKAMDGRIPDGVHDDSELLDPGNLQDGGTDADAPAPAQPGAEATKEDVDAWLSAARRAKETAAKKAGKAAEVPKTAADVPRG